MKPRKVNKIVEEVTKNIIKRSKSNRLKYLQKLNAAKDLNIRRDLLSCGNIAHSVAGCSSSEKKEIISGEKPNIAIVSAYNDMLSAHKPYENYPSLIKNVIRKNNGTCQFAGGVPAMCDGITQGQAGMELSLFSRDVIALSTAIGLSHNMFDSVLCLGICDKIVPGELIGALKFGHLPIIFVPGGPMKTGISNEEKAKVRRAFASGEIDRQALLKSESKAYHSSGTCTFYGTANSNQMLMEIMGLQLPGSSFVNPDTEHRSALNKEAVKLAIESTIEGSNYRPLFDIIDEKAIVNAIIGLLASGGSTNHTLHLIAIAKAAGIIINWEDFSDLSEIIPSLVKMYPNGSADVNYFHACGGMPLLIKTLLNEGLLHRDVNTILGHGLEKFTKESYLKNGVLTWRDCPNESADQSVPVSYTHLTLPTNREV